MHLLLKAEGPIALRARHNLILCVCDAVVGGQAAKWSPPFQCQVSEGAFLSDSLRVEWLLPAPMQRLRARNGMFYFTRATAHPALRLQRAAVDADTPAAAPAAAAVTAPRARRCWRSADLPLPALVWTPVRPFRAPLRQGGAWPPHAAAHWHRRRTTCWHCEALPWRLLAPHRCVWQRARPWSAVELSGL